jgi:hypothetical protein
MPARGEKQDGHIHLYARLGIFSLVVLVTRTYCAIAVRTYARTRFIASYRIVPYPYIIPYHARSVYAGVGEIIANVGCGDAWRYLRLTLLHY